MSKLWIEFSGQVVESLLDGTRAVLEVLSPTAGPDRPAEAKPETGAVIVLSARQRGLLESLVKRPTAAQRLVKRARIILGLAAGQSPNQVAKALGIMRQTVYKWRDRWRAAAAHLDEAEMPETPDKRLAELLEQVLLDGYRRGKRATFSPEQIVKIVALACEHPKASGRFLSHWTSKSLAAEVIKRGIVKTICRATISRLLKDAKIKPHRSRYWLNACPADPAQFDEQVRQICAIYRQAATLHRQGIHVVCIDEKTGIQALEHKYPAKGVKPGYVARIEH
ncbi:MAG: helix-turn-helix domain-containing protein, partial [Shimia sp.]|nr:helix-turn-helix domain-containing protein [Shimia sp.]